MNFTNFQMTANRFVVSFAKAYRSYRAGSMNLQEAVRDIV